MSQGTSRSSWWGWGDPALARPLSPELLDLVRQGLSVGRPGPPVPDLGDLRLPPVSLPAPAQAALTAVVGAEHVADDDESRIRHTRGKSTPDLLRLRLGDLADAPDAVVSPASHQEVLEVLEACTAHQVAVVPFGGGTSVVGGLAAARTPFAGLIALDLGRLRRLLWLDEESRVAALEPGLRGPEAEGLLGERGYTLGHFPQSFEYATLGGFAAARSSGQASAGYGRFDERVVGLRIAAPAGGLELGRAPRSAAGPDLRQLFLGSEGALGVITALSLEICPRPVARRYDGWRFADFRSGSRVLRRLAQDGPVPTVLRLSDEVETALNLARPDAVGAKPAGGCLAIVGYEGTEADVAACAAGAEALLRSGGGEPVAEAGEAWEHGRFSAPYLRDALLGAGALVETLETVAFWSALPRLYAAVRTALNDSLSAQGTPPLVLCHVSHVYRSGASLYFTVACAQTDDPVGQWWQAKRAASDAILEAGGSITHHHGVGTDHRPWFEREVGPLGVSALRAVKRQLDPAGIMNPGVLLP